MRAHILLLMLLAAAVGFLATVAPPAAAQVGGTQTLLSLWFSQKGTMTPGINQPPPRGQLVQRRPDGVVIGVWGCVQFNQLPPGNDVVCGYLDVYPEPPARPAITGATWVCFPATNVLVYSEPFNKGACGWAVRPASIKNSFVPNCRQLDASSRVLNALYAVRGYGSNYPLADANRHRPASCNLPALRRMAASGADASAEDANLARLLVERDLVRNGYMSVDRELADEPIPTVAAAALRNGIDPATACRNYATSITNAEGRQQVKVVLIQSVKADLELGTIGIKGPLRTVGLAIFSYVTQTTVGPGRPALIQQKFISQGRLVEPDRSVVSVARKAGKGFDTLAEAIAANQRLGDLVEQNGLRVDIRTANCLTAG